MKILDRLPITRGQSSIRFGGRFLAVRPDQIVVWISLHLASVVEPEANAPVFPALLDTGNNFGLSIRERHASEWAGLDPRLLVHLGQLRIDNQTVHRREAAAWLYPNLPGRSDAAIGRRPFRLELGKGIAVYPSDADPPGPRLPLIGLPALLENGLDCWLDPDRRHVTVQSRSWRRPLMRLLGRL